MANIFSDIYNFFTKQKITKPISNNTLATKMKATPVSKNKFTSPTSKSVSTPTATPSPLRIPTVMKANPKPTYKPLSIPTLSAVSPTKKPISIPTVPMAKPTPTLIPNLPNPYFENIKNYFPENEWNKTSNVMKGESSFNPYIVNVNVPGGKNFHEEVSNENRLNELINKHGSVDIGLMQINSSSPIKDYLAKRGLKWADLLNPDVNLQTAYDLWSGLIPGKPPGWGGWFTPYARE